MKRMINFMVICLLVSVVLVGCGQPKAESASAAIQNSESIASPREKADYLVGQAQAFMASDEFQEAVNVLQYVLATVDRDSERARRLLDQAKEELAAQARSAAEDLRKSFGGFGE